MIAVALSVPVSDPEQPLSISGGGVAVGIVRVKKRSKLPMSKSLWIRRKYRSLRDMNTVFETRHPSLNVKRYAGRIAGVVVLLLA